MPRTFLALRSVLYVPGSYLRAMEKSITLPADGIIFDLEDAVAPGVKIESRERVCEFVRKNDFGNRQVVIRVNSLASSWGYGDLVYAARSGATAVLIPKVESGDMVRQTETILNEFGAEEMEIWCMMETPRGMLHAEEIATASSRIRALVMGTSDLAKDLGASHTRERLPFLTSLGLCLLSARAADVAIVDGVQLDLEDGEAFEHVCKQGLELGFDGKTLIHPKTIGTANQVFAPSAEDIEMAERIIVAHKEAQKKGEGVVVLDGRLIENLHVEGARRNLLLARAIKDMEEKFGIDQGVFSSQ